MRVLCQFQSNVCEYASLDADMTNLHLSIACQHLSADSH